ncbi:hypothetical protein [Arthrobacter sp. lap29]|uniref:hypothetical protein n=1 Tax=Arthrobacter sp. lap29 TaxID=3056122 RepID=UPI0028F72EB2|nr:hypothetical protein [Arthrobacter sp. lap29]
MAGPQPFAYIQYGIIVSGDHGLSPCPLIIFGLHHTNRRDGQRIVCPISSNPRSCLVCKLSQSVHWPASLSAFYPNAGDPFPAAILCHHNLDQTLDPDRGSRPGCVDGAIASDRLVAERSAVLGVLCSSVEKLHPASLLVIPYLDLLAVSLFRDGAHSLGSGQAAAFPFMMLIFSLAVAIKTSGTDGQRAALRGKDKLQRTSLAESHARQRLMETIVDTVSDQHEFDGAVIAFHDVTDIVNALCAKK